MNVKVNDTVLVLTGKYKGKQGKVLKTYPDAGKVIVEGVNIVHKHEKARKATETSRIVTEEAPIDVSNVEVVCDKCGKATRVAHLSKSSATSAARRPASRTPWSTARRSASARSAAPSSTRRM